MNIYLAQIKYTWNINVVLIHFQSQTLLLCFSYCTWESRYTDRHWHWMQVNLQVSNIKTSGDFCYYQHWKIWHSFFVSPFPWRINGRLFWMSSLPWYMQFCRIERRTLYNILPNADREMIFPKAKQKYRGMFETQKFGKKTNFGTISLSIRTRCPEA